MNEPYSIFDTQIGLDPWLRKQSLDFSINSVTSQTMGGVSTVLGGSVTGVNDELSDPISDSISPVDILSGELGSVVGHGKKTFSDTMAGFLMGLDTDGTYKWVVGSSSSSVDWNVTTAATLTIKGNLVSGSIDIPDSVTSNSFHVDSSGNTWWGSTTLGAATAKVLNTGAATFSSITISGYVVSTKGSFGGDGSDGALAITSGTTTIDCANAAIVVKNYTSISITGTGKLAFSNPHAGGTIVVLKSQGGVTLTSSQAPMIDMSSMGAAGGTGGAVTANGTAGTNANFILDSAIHYGGKGVTSGGSDPGGLIYSSTGIVPYTNATNTLWRRTINIVPGSGGGGGGGSSNTGTGTARSGGNGGRGGGALYIECNGAWNFTTTSGISVAGGAGVAALATGGTKGGAGGGGAGAAGMFLALYNSLTSNAGTVNTAGGVGGDGGSGGGGGVTGTGGSGAGSYASAGGLGGGGAAGSGAGAVAASAGGGGGNGSDNGTTLVGGTAGISDGNLVELNNYF